MVILDITKKKLNYLITFDTGEVIVSNEDTIIEYYLRKGKEVDDTLYQKIKEDSLFYEFYEKALNYLSKGLCSKTRIKLFLAKKGANNDEINRAIKLLENKNLINDLDYFTSLSDYYIRKNYGPFYIKNKGREEQIDSNIIDEVMSYYTEDDYVSHIELLIEKYIKTNKENDIKKLKDKLKKYLYQRGFSMEQIISKVEGFNYEDR